MISPKTPNSSFSPSPFRVSANFSEPRNLGRRTLSPQGRKAATPRGRKCATPRGRKARAPLAKRSNRISVSVRVRPPPMMTERIVQLSEFINTSHHERTVTVGHRKYKFDAVFDSSMTQSDVYKHVSDPLLSAFLNGYNSTVIAYGQTGSGKTFTMGSDIDRSFKHFEREENGGHNASTWHGLIPRFTQDIFDAFRRSESKPFPTSTEEKFEQNSHSSKANDFELTASFLQVYGEEIYDLLIENCGPLPLRQDANGNVVVVDLKQVPISSAADALKVLHDGALKRTTASTPVNHRSSRSHAVFTLSARKLSQVGAIGGESAMDTTTSSHFTFVDLAGSERMKKTGAEGQRAREGIHINKGLLALGGVIKALSEEETSERPGKVHVPYRESKLTRLLQDALGGNSQTLFIACVSPADTDAGQTLSTLEYANRTQHIRNTQVKNVEEQEFEFEDIHSLMDDLITRTDVQDYLQCLYNNREEQEQSSLTSLSLPSSLTAPKTPPPLSTDMGPAPSSLDAPRSSPETGLFAKTPTRATVTCPSCKFHFATEGASPKEDTKTPGKVTLSSEGNPKDEQNKEEKEENEATNKKDKRDEKDEDENRQMDHQFHEDCLVRWGKTIRGIQALSVNSQAKIFTPKILRQGLKALPKELWLRVRNSARKLTQNQPGNDERLDMKP